jgi:hypothetical protein
MNFVDRHHLEMLLLVKCNKPAQIGLLVFIYLFCLFVCLFFCFCFFETEHYRVSKSSSNLKKIILYIASVINFNKFTDGHYFIKTSVSGAGHTITFCLHHGRHHIHYDWYVEWVQGLPWHYFYIIVLVNIAL